jgi:drug/metabolite transporter (DMT)-like permease
MHLSTYLSLTLTMLLWGGTFIAGRMLAETVAPATAAFLRFAIASIAMLLLTRLTGTLQRPGRNHLLPLLMLGATGIFSYNVCFFIGLKHITAGRAALFVACTPLVITLLSLIFNRERLPFFGFAGILISLIGAVFVISNGHPQLLFQGSFGIGELALIGCVLSWAAYTLIGRSILTTLSPLSSVCYSSLIGTLMLLFPALHAGLPSALGRLSSADWTNLAYLGIGGTAIGFSLYYHGIKKIGAPRAGVFINLVPLFALLLSWRILNESVRYSVFAGGILILAGVSITNLAGRRAAASMQKPTASRKNPQPSSSKE